ncbi:FT like protein [Tanacetum coccineum]
MRRLICRDGEKGEKHLSLCVLAMKAWLGLGRYGGTEKDLKERCNISTHAAIRVVQRVVGGCVNGEGSTVRVKLIIESIRIGLSILMVMTLLANRICCGDCIDYLASFGVMVQYALHELGISSRKPHKKCARVVGEVIGKFHPHGDNAVYDSLVRMAQEFSLRCPLVSGHGNFGSLYGDNLAALRYTECRLEAIIELMLLSDLDMDMVDFVANFDSSLKEPSLLPARIPNLLLNGSSGIAVGMATNIPPHNLGELVDALSVLIHNPDASVDIGSQNTPDLWIPKTSYCSTKNDCSSLLILTRSISNGGDPLVVARVIGDVLDSFTKSINLSVSYDDREVNNGCELKPSQIVNQPRVDIGGDDMRALLTLVMVDPDAPTPSNPNLGEYLHWLVTNIPATTGARFGQEIVSYESPRPSMGIHRMVFVLFRQMGRQTVYAPGWRQNFNTKDFAELYNLGSPVAAVYVQLNLLRLFHTDNNDP